jgi:threonine/homoserine/homoserine lactone efflux protein
MHMSFFDASALFVIMITLAAIPSTSVALVVTRSASLGFSNGAAVSMGIVLGDLIFALLAILGLTALSEMMGAFFLVIKYAAGVYLIWLGITLIKNRAIVYSFHNRSSGGGIFVSFFAGLFVTLGDIKAIFFYASLFPTFLDLSVLELSDVFVILFVTAITVGSVKLGYAFAAEKVIMIGKGHAIEKEAKLTSGALMVGAGTYLIAKT